MSKLSFAKDSSPTEILISDLELKGLLYYLNVGTSREQRRVIGILEQMLLLSGVEQHPTNRQSKGQLKSDVVNLANTLNQQLARYRFTPRVHYSGARNLAIAWDRDWRKQYRALITPAQLYETQAIDYILGLVRSRRIHLLRRCTQCREWLFARSRNQKFCSFKCQQKDYTQSESWKSHRREYMREYYKANYAKHTNK